MGSMMLSEVKISIYFHTLGWVHPVPGSLMRMQNLIGYVIALDVGKTEYGVQVLENVVMVGTSNNIDWSPLFKEFYE